MSIPHARFRSRIVDLLHAKTWPAGRRRYILYPRLLVAARQGGFMT